MRQARAIGELVATCRLWGGARRCLVAVSRFLRGFGARSALWARHSLLGSRNFPRLTLCEGAVLRGGGSEKFRGSTPCKGTPTEAHENLEIDPMQSRGAAASRRRQVRARRALRRYCHTSRNLTPCSPLGRRRLAAERCARRAPSRAPAQNLKINPMQSGGAAASSPPWCARTRTLQCFSNSLLNSLLSGNLLRCGAPRHARGPLAAISAHPAVPIGS
jgi:hypothetical protein